MMHKIFKANDVVKLLQIQALFVQMYKDGFFSNLLWHLNNLVLINNYKINSLIIGNKKTWKQTILKLIIKM